MGVEDGCGGPLSVGRGRASLVILARALTLCDLGQLISLQFVFPHLEKGGNCVWLLELVN